MEEQVHHIGHGIRGFTGWPNWGNLGIRFRGGSTSSEGSEFLEEVRSRGHQEGLRGLEAH